MGRSFGMTILFRDLLTFKVESQRATQERAFSKGSSKDHLGIYARSQKKDQKEAEPKMIKARAVTIVKIQALIDFYHIAVPFSQTIPSIR